MLLSKVYTLDTSHMKTIIHIKTDAQLKREAAETAKKMGFSLSAVVNGFLRNYVQTQELHITSAPQMTLYLESILKAIELDIKTGRNLSPSFKGAGKAIKYLRSIKK